MHGPGARIHFPDERPDFSVAETLHKDVVLIGAGHAHLHLIKHAGRFRDCGVRLTLIDPHGFWYSGLATGVLGGMYPPELDYVDPEPLIAEGGGRWIRDRLVGLDPQQRIVTLESGQTLHYDAVSLNVGSEVRTADIEGVEHAWTVKPIYNLLRLRQEISQRLAAKESLRAIVVGGGATSCEVAANLAALGGNNPRKLHVTLLARGDRLLHGRTTGASRSVTAALTRRQITLRRQATVTRVEPGRVHLRSNETLAANYIVLATGLQAAMIVQNLGLPHDEEGLVVDRYLHSVADPCVFGAGDCIRFENRALQKLGVYSVRQAPVLLHNLLATVNEQPLQSYRPQKRSLEILNLAGGDGLLLWGPFHYRGRCSLRWKDWLDRRFLAQYQQPT